MSIDLARLPSDLRAAITRELQASEHVNYAGMPDWRAQAGQLLIIFTFGFCWSLLCFPMAFFVWAETLGFRPAESGKAMGTGLGIFFCILITPFVVIGASMLAAPFIAVAKSRRTAHVVTDVRLINVTTGAKPEVESFKLTAINFIKRRDGKAGAGSLSIGYGVEKDSDGDPRPLTTDWAGIPDVRRAESAIRSLAKWVR